MADTPKGRATRARILDAAWQLSDAKGADVILGGVTLREIAAAVDMTPSAVAYHFPTMRELSVAMVQRLADSVSLLPIEAVDELLARASDGGLAAVIRLAAQSNWDILTEPYEVDFERRLTRCYAATGDNPDSPEIKRLIGAMTSAWISDVALVYRRTAEEMGLQPIEPFTFDDLARGAAAITEGLVYHWMCEPGAVRHDLAADLLVALVSTLMVPTPHTMTLAERAGDLPGRPQVARSAPDGDLDLAARAAPLFASGIEDVTLTEAGRLLGISTEETSDRFGSVPLLAALSFGRHVPVVAESVERRRAAGPAVSLTDGVYELGRCALADRHTAMALLHERHRAAAAEPDRPPARDVRQMVALSPLLADPLGKLLDGSPSDVVEVADLLTESVLCQAATRPRTPVATITETALRLVPVDF
jgi:AcrR family transcriptional regulator